MMSSDKPLPGNDDSLESSPEFREESLSTVELPSSLQERLEAAWNSRRPKFYERLAPAQKHWVDKLVAIRLNEFQAHLVALDREDSELARQIAELATQITQMGHRLASLEARLDQLEGPASDEANE